MSGLKNETKRVKLLLDEITANPEMFGGLEEKKITPALIAYQCCSLESLSHSIDNLSKTLDGALKFEQSKKGIYYQKGEGV